MKIRALIVACLLAAMAVSAPRATAQEENVAGTWTGTAKGVAGSRQLMEEFTMVLSQTGENVTGTYQGKLETGGVNAGRERPEVRVRGTLIGNKLSLVIAKDGKLDATVNGNAMLGSLARGNNLPLTVSAAKGK